MSTKLERRVPRCVPGVVAMLVCLMVGGSGAALAATPIAVSMTSRTTYVEGIGVGAKSEFFDTATLAGAPSNAPAPTGTVTFTVYGPITYPAVPGADSCTGKPIDSSTNPLGTTGSSTSSTFFPPEGEEKVYLFVAAYSGDSIYAPVTSECDAPGESVTVPFVAFAVPQTTVSQPGVSPSKAAPPTSISQFRFAPTTFSVGTRTHTKRRGKSKRRSHRPGRTATISYVLSGPGTVTITISKISRGLRKPDGACLPIGGEPLKDTDKEKDSGSHHQADCQSPEAVGTLVLPSHAGDNSYAFNGRLGSRLLTAGSYHAEATITVGTTTLTNGTPVSPGLAKDASFQITSTSQPHATQ